MNTEAIRRFLFLLLGIIILTAWGQQPALSVTTEASLRISTNQDTSNTSRTTSDGAAACPLADGVSQLGNRPGSGVLQPVATKGEPPRWPDEARKYARKFMKDQHIKRFEAKVVLSLTVGIDGVPHDICVIDEAGHGLDRSAVAAVKEYRFKPATLNGKPVPVRLTVAVDFVLR